VQNESLTKSEVGGIDFLPVSIVLPFVTDRSIALSKPYLMPNRKAVDMEAESGIQCPRCGSDAWYHFGRTITGKQRFICQVCARQFIVDYSYKSIITNRPRCPECGEFMHVYMRDRSHIRFRCASYPRCRCFLKTEAESANAVSERPIRTLQLYRRNPLPRKGVVVP
jgi:transposase-like protein